MSRGFPSMTALLGLLAIAGYQNWDKIAEMLGGLGQGKSGAPNETGLGGLLGKLGGSLGGTSAGGVLSGGLGELLEQFKQNGQGETADFLGQNRSQQTGNPLPAGASGRLGGVGDVVATDRAVAPGVARPIVPRTS